MVSDYPDDAVRRATRALYDSLALKPADVVGLMELARTRPGETRALRCVESVRSGRLTRRGEALASLAGLVVGHSTLGEEWWSHPCPSPVAGRFAEGLGGLSPDEFITSPPPDPSWDGALDQLLYQARSDVADKIWGPPAGSIELQGHWSLDDPVSIPAHAKIGDRIVVEFEIGSRIDAEVVLRGDGALGTRLDMSSVRHDPLADVRWSWSIASGMGPHRFPGEVEGEASDPYAVIVDARFIRLLKDGAARHPELAALLPEPSTRGDVIRAVREVYVGGTSWLASWTGAAEALIDGDDGGFACAIDQLSRIRS